MSLHGGREQQNHAEFSSILRWCSRVHMQENAARSFNGRDNAMEWNGMQCKRKSLTEHLFVAVLVDLDPGRGHRGRVAAGVPWHADVEMPRLLGLLTAAAVVLGEGELADDHLERSSGRQIVLDEGRQHAAAAAVGDLPVVRRAGRQVHHDGPPLAAMRAGVRGADAGAVALLRRLRAHRVPDDLIASPVPAQPPPRMLDVPVHLVVVDAYHDLRTEQIDSSSLLRSGYMLHLRMHQ